MIQIKNTLMERRKKNLGQLKNSIKVLSCVQKKSDSLLNKEPLKQFHSVGMLQQYEGDEKSTKMMPQVFIRRRRESERSVPSSEQDERQNAFEQKYNIEEKLGQGAHGVVRKCTLKLTGKVFAVKTLQMQDQHFRSIKTNFINIKKLKHKSLIGYKALYLSRKQRLCNLVMEYCPHSHLKQGLSEDQLRATFYNILNALSFLHKNHICHRDIKPQNILVDKASGQVKIIDFGVSKNLKIRGRYEEMLTNTGTYYYKAPEMFLGGGYSEAIDSWAAGISLYEMVTGVTPFASVYHSETINNILHQQLDLEREQFNTYNPIIKNLITHLLKRNPKERITCQQAKKHLWFYSNLTGSSLMKSAGVNTNIKNDSGFKANQLGLKSVKRKISHKEAKCNQEQISKEEKKVIKAWLQIINEDTSSTNIAQNVKIDFTESEDQEINHQLHQFQSANFDKKISQPFNYELPTSVVTD